MTFGNRFIAAGTAIAAVVGLGLSIPVMANPETTPDSMLVSQGMEEEVRGTVLEMIGNRVRIRDHETGEAVFYDISESMQIDAGLQEGMEVVLVVMDEEVVAVREYIEDEDSIAIEEEVGEESGGVVVEREMEQGAGIIVVEQESTTTVVETVVEEETVVVEEETMVTPQSEPVRALW